MNFSETSSGLKSKPHVPSKELIALAPKSVPQVTKVSGNISDIVLTQSTKPQKKLACTAELVRQLVLNSRKGPGREQSSQACPSQGAFTNSSSLPASRSSSPGQLLHSALPMLQGNMIVKGTSSKRPNVIELNKEQNDARLKRVRENLMKLKEERDSTTSTQSALNVKKIPPKVSSTAAKILVSSVQEKPYLEAIQPFLKRRINTSTETELVSRIGKDKGVFKGYSSKKVEATKTATSISSGDIRESNPQAINRMNVTKVGNPLTVFKTSTSSTVLPAEKPVTNAPTCKSNKRTAQIVTERHAKVGSKTGQSKKPGVSAKKSLSLSPKKSVTFNPAKTVEFASGAKIALVMESSANSAFRIRDGGKIALVTSTDAAFKIRDGSPAAKRGRRNPAHSPKLSPRRQMSAAPVPELGMKRHTPTHVLKRLASPPRAKIIEKSSDLVKAAPLLSKSKDSSELKPSQSTDKKQSTLNKVSCPGGLGTYLEGGSTSPRRRYTPYSKRLKQLHNGDDA